MKTTSTYLQLSNVDQTILFSIPALSLIFIPVLIGIQYIKLCNPNIDKHGYIFLNLLRIRTGFDPDPTFTDIGSDRQEKTGSGPDSRKKRNGIRPYFFFF